MQKVNLWNNVRIDLQNIEFKVELHDLTGRGQELTSQLQF